MTVTRKAYISISFTQRSARHPFKQPME